ncbi:MAG: hypothetical protein P4K98_06250 [Bryobacteraceae bacterium]|nr:hypothetical protein [Bryobacteraceae bacterium]
MSEDDVKDTSPEEAAVRAAELERQLADLRVRSREQAVRAELKTEALRAGMVDLDGLKLVDASGLTVGEDGEVTGATALMHGLRRAKPWLFASASASSSATPPPVQPPRARPATEMTTEEWRAARADLLRRR